MSGSSGARSRGGLSGLQNLHSLSRALSPSAQAAASAGTSAALSVALTACNTVEEVIAVIPVRYSETLAPILRTHADYVERATSTRRQRLELAEASESGQYPKWLTGSIGIPAFQPMQQFVSDADGAQMIQAYRAARVTARNSAMNSWIIATCSFLDSQYRFFLDKITGDNPENELRVAIRARTEELVEQFPIMRDDPEADVNEDGSRPQIPSLDTTRTRYEFEQNKCLGLVQNIVEAVRNVVTARHTRRAAKDNKKAALKRQAEDAVMAEATPGDAGPSRAPPASMDAATLRRIIREEVSASTVSPLPTSLDLIVNRLVEKAEAWPEGEFPSWQEENVGQQRPDAFQSSQHAERQRQRTWKAWQRGSARTILEDRVWTYDNPCSYPDLILEISPMLACEIIAFRAPLAVKEALKFRHAIHVQQGLAPPSEILFDLGVGMRYILPITVKPSLPVEAWDDFCRRFRWFFFFTENPPHATGDLPYDPAFDARVRPSARRAPKAPDAIERGLAEGRSLLSSWTPEAPTPTETLSRRLAPPLRSAINEWVMANEVIITQTDKNLGLALIKKDWFVRETRKLLYNETDYTRITCRIALEHLQTQAFEYSILLSEWEANTTLPQNKQLHDYLAAGIQPFLGTDGMPRSIELLFAEFEQSCIDAQVTVALLPNTPIARGLELYREATPQFYGLPKIHKNPWKMRPIFPCHSAIIAHPATVLSKLLKLLIADRPYVLEGSKAFVTDLQKVAIPPRMVADQKIFIITADIVAYYPNVPVQDAVEVIKEMWLWLLCERSVPKVYAELFNDLLELNTRLPNVCQFLEEYFIQQRGLAMGMHCAPDLANLYAAFYEEKFIPAHQNILFYRRFIDDLFFLVRAESPEQAAALVRGLKLPGCEFTWSEPAQSASFLDVFVWLSSFSGCQWKPFRKARNHLERIPWISAHPLPVKRGAFYGEMSRLAILSSTESTFREQLIDLANLYLARGYPNKVIQSWLKESNARWHNRFVSRVSREDSLILKSEMNPIWNNFPIQQLTEVVHSEWRKVTTDRSKRQLEEAPPPAAVRRRIGDDGSFSETVILDSPASDLTPGSSQRIQPLISRPFMISKRRVPNVNDLFNAWKKQLTYAVLSDQQSTALWPEVGNAE
jgi:hypothetical protein